jgi:hypothetical protein
MVSVVTDHNSAIAGRRERMSVDGSDFGVLLAPGPLTGAALSPVKAGEPRRALRYPWRVEGTSVEVDRGACPAPDGVWRGPHHARTRGARSHRPSAPLKARHDPHLPRKGERWRMVRPRGPGAAVPRDHPRMRRDPVLFGGAWVGLRAGVNADFDTKVAVIVRDDLAGWQRLNVAGVRSDSGEAQYRARAPRAPRVPIALYTMDVRPRP